MVVTSIAGNAFADAAAASLASDSRKDLLTFVVRSPGLFLRYRFSDCYHQGLENLREV